MQRKGEEKESLMFFTSRNQFTVNLEVSIACDCVYYSMKTISVVISACLPLTRLSAFLCSTLAGTQLNIHKRFVIKLHAKLSLTLLSPAMSVPDDLGWHSGPCLLFQHDERRGRGTATSLRPA